MRQIRSRPASFVALVAQAVEMQAHTSATRASESTLRPQSRLAQEPAPSTGAMDARIPQSGRVRRRAAQWVDHHERRMRRSDSSGRCFQILVETLAGAARRSRGALIDDRGLMLAGAGRPREMWGLGSLRLAHRLLLACGAAQESLTSAGTGERLRLVGFELRCDLAAASRSVKAHSQLRLSHRWRFGPQGVRQASRVTSGAARHPV